MKPSKILLAAAWIAGAALACAQSQEPVQPAQPAAPVVQATPPAPTAAQTAPPAAQEQSTGSQQYEGPSIISRDKTLIGERGGKLLDFRVWAGINGVYDTGLTPVSTDQTGHITNVGGSEGVEANFGASGSRQWKRDSLGLDYSGTFRHYANNPGYDGIDQFLSFRYGRSLSRHFTLDVKENAGTSNLANGAYSYLPLTSIDLAATPTNDLFDNRTYFSQSRVGLIWQKSARLSLSVSGQGYLVRRAATALAGLNGYTGSADAAYRVTRRQTLSVSYGYTYYDYQRLFGFAKVQTFSAGYSIGLGRRWDASFSFGGSHAEARGLQQVAVDPAIVAIIGVPTIVTSFDSFITVPYGAASIIRRFNRSALTVNGSTGVSPGNGVYLTSRQTGVSSSYSYVGLRRWTMGASFSFAELSSIGQTGLGKYTNYVGGVGTTYKLGGQMHVELRYDYRHYSTGNSPTTGNPIYLKDSQRVTLGFAWSPGAMPLAIW